MTKQPSSSQPARHKSLENAIWQDSALTEALNNLLETRDKQPTMPEQVKSRAGRVRSFYALAASIMVCIVSLSVYWFGAPEHQDAERPTIARQAERYSAQEAQNIQLSDGSVVAMNRQTDMTFMARVDKREVLLTRGEAFFDVARDESKPFTVKVGEALVTVLGTQFNINRTPNKTWIEVYHGHVEVTLADKKIDLLKGQRVIVTGNSGLQQRFNAEQPSWQTGWLDFSQINLSEAAYLLSRYSNKPVVIEGQQTNMLISGRFKADDTAASLQLIGQLYPLSIQEYPDSFVIRPD